MTTAMKIFNFLTRKKNSNKFEFRCADCGMIHQGLPSPEYAKPVYYFDVPDNEVSDRIDLTKDLCRITPATNDPNGETIYSIRTILEIPIIDLEEPFTFGVWVSQSKESYERYVHTFDQNQSHDGSFGWLAISMPQYNVGDSDEGFESLACDLEWGVVGQRPKCILHECNHPVFHDQVNGISPDKAVEFARITLHG